MVLFAQLAVILIPKIFFSKSKNNFPFSEQNFANPRQPDDTELNFIIV